MGTRQLYGRTARVPRQLHHQRRGLRGVGIPPHPSAHLARLRSEAFHAIFGLAPRIAAASFVAFLAGSFINAYVMSKMKISSSGRNFSARAILSTVFGELTDSIIFFPLAFSFVMPWEEMPSLVITQVLLKSLYEALALPMTIRVVKFTKAHDHEDVFDRDIAYNIFKVKDI